MTFEEARDELAVLCDAASDPILTEDDLERIVMKARRVDGDGRVVSDPNWTPTFDLAWAAKAGWELKAARAAGRFDFTADGTTFNRSQVRQACLEMAAMYRRQLTASPRCV